MKTILGYLTFLSSLKQIQQLCFVKFCNWLNFFDEQMDRCDGWTNEQSNGEYIAVPKDEYLCDILFQSIRIPFVEM